MIDSSVAAALRLRTLGPARKTRTLGCETIVQSVRINDWALGSTKLPAMTIAEQALPTVRVGGHPLSGLLGASLLARFGTLTLDYDAHRVILGGAVPATPRAVPIEIVRRRSNDLIEVRATIAGSSAEWILDSGAESVAIAAHLAAALDLPRAGRTQISYGAAGCVSKSSPVRVGDWRTGGVKLPSTIALTSSDPVIARPARGLSTAGLIGADVLAAFGETTFDFTHHRLVLGGAP